jgi:hypothetical protein
MFTFRSRTRNRRDIILAHTALAINRGKFRVESNQAVGAAADRASTFENTWKVKISGFCLRIAPSYSGACAGAHIHTAAEPAREDPCRQRQLC